MTTNITKSDFRGRRTEKKYFGHRKANDISFPDQNPIFFKLAVGFEPPDLPISHLWQSYLG